ncbi:MAG TPA: lysophospholipase [Bacillota bacterium]|nr:lysophospholipase [Bacillota bacterium]HUM55830.1 lysophospholipase [Bacillota bacterium]
MFENFPIKGSGEKDRITGYLWAKEEPDYVICIIHGIGEHAGRYDRMNKFLSEANIACLSMDLKGHGASSGKRGHCAPRESVLGDIDILLEHAMKKYPNKPVILYGHSLGGNIALDYRARGKLNDKPFAYIISAPWIELVNKPAAPLFLFVKIMARICPEMTIKSSVNEEDLGHPLSVQPYKTNPMVHDKISMLCAFEAFEKGEALAKNENEDNGRSKGQPLLVMHGTEDRVCSIEGSRKFVSHEKEACTYIEWEGMFHEIHNGNKENDGTEVIMKMIEWIRGLKA